MVRLKSMNEENLSKEIVGLFELMTLILSFCSLVVPLGTLLLALASQIRFALASLVRSIIIYFVLIVPEFFLA